MPTMISRIAQQLQAVHARMALACDKANRPPQAVQLLAVSKTFDNQAVMDAAAAGQRAFGENYIQEAVDKITALRNERVNGLPLQWHCIGPIQSNKTKLVAEHFDWAHTVDRLKTAQRLNDQRPSHLPPLQVCVQVNVAAVANKSGLMPPEALALCEQVAQLPRLQLRGLMSIPDPVLNANGGLDPAAMQTLFAEVTQLHNTIGKALGSPAHWDTLSMGMSADLESAIAAGSTLVRVGSAIFGARD
jgi:PLP dependent protein